MGIAHSIHNRTPYTWYYRNMTSDDSDRTLPGGSSCECTAAKIETDKVRLKYGNHSDWDLRYRVNRYSLQTATTATALPPGGV